MVDVITDKIFSEIKDSISIDGYLFEEYIIKSHPYLDDMDEEQYSLEYDKLSKEYSHMGISLTDI